MANSYQQFLGDGSTVLFGVPFGYLAKAHVKVFVAGVEDTTFTWASSSSIQVATPPLLDDIVLIRRVTPTAPMVDFVDGSTLTEANLDAATIQSLYIAEESQDNLGAVLQQGMERECCEFRCGTSYH